MVDIGFIVHSLNAPPFNMDLTLVDFDEKKPFERLQVMNIILGSLSTTQVCCVSSTVSPTFLAFMTRCIGARIKLDSLHTWSMVTRFTVVFDLL